MGGISWQGLCRDCGLIRTETNYDALQSKTGPFALWWAARLADSLGLYPLDELPPKP